MLRQVRQAMVRDRTSPWVQALPWVGQGVKEELADELADESPEEEELESETTSDATTATEPAGAGHGKTQTENYLFGFDAELQAWP